LWAAYFLPKLQHPINYFLLGLLFIISVLCYDIVNCKENDLLTNREAMTMAVKIKTKAGTIDIDNDVISTVVGGAATDNYGVVGMASRNPVRDGVNQILRRENFNKGVVVRQQDNGIVVDVNIIVSYGTKISEVSKSVQAKVKYNLESMLGITADAVNVCVQGVRSTED
jgi:uncharacterized alkaline shock family protein YloU